MDDPVALLVTVMTVRAPPASRRRAGAPQTATPAKASDLAAHVQHEVSVCGKERHLTVGSATIGAMRVGLNEYADR